MSRVVVIGVGNPYRHDDAAGLVAVERLARRLPDGVDVVPCEQEPSRIVDAWQGARAAVVVDAVSSGAEPGTLHRFDASASPVPARVFHSSTHAFGIAQAIELARALGRLPERVVVHGVEAANFSAGDGLTGRVDAAIDPLVDAVASDVEELLREGVPCTSKP